jgi:hypothetical protein
MRLITVSIFIRNPKSGLNTNIDAPVEEELVTLQITHKRGIAQEKK